MVDVTERHQRSARYAGHFNLDRVRVLRSFLVGLALLGCSDFANLWSDPPYVVHWIDDPDNITLNYDLGNNTSIGRVGPKVVEVGSNKQFVVARQSTGGYYYIDRSRDSSGLNAEAVVGPISRYEFEMLQKELHLPAFSKSFER